MNELADLVLEQTKSSAEKKHLPLPADDPSRRQPDITLAKKILSWEPTTQLVDGLRPTVEYFEGVVNSQSGPGIRAEK